MFLSILLYFLKRPFHFIKTGLLKGLVSQIQYKFPARKLEIIAITGTDGKTTSSTLLYKVLQQAGKKVALLSTVAAYMGTEEIDTGFHVTTPDPKALQKFLRRLVDEGYEYVVIETTSQGIYQYRLWGISPEIAAVTNITHDHLDYHRTYELYLQAKAKILAKAKVAILNADDDASIHKLKKILQPKSVRVRTYSRSDSLPTVVRQAITARFTQQFNQMNARMVYTIAKELEVKNADIAMAIRDFAGIPGRMELVKEKSDLTVVVDFAHTPNGLQQALLTLSAQMKKMKSHKGRLIAVFGCAGLRDVSKRPIMGRIASEIADLVILTAEDPRTENPWSIIQQIKSDLGDGHGKIISIVDRREAIIAAITKFARKGDTIGIFGKGHEKSMCYGTIEYSWSDFEVAREALRLRMK